MKRRVKSITLTNPETGKAKLYRPTDPLPDWIDEKDINPKAFADDGEDVPATSELNSMTVPQLLALAKEQGVELTSTKKSEVIAALESLGDEAEDGEGGGDDGNDG